MHTHGDKEYGRHVKNKYVHEYTCYGLDMSPKGDVWVCLPRVMFWKLGPRVSMLRGDETFKRSLLVIGSH